MNETPKLTKGEIETLRTILRFGGRVVVSMGRKLDAQHVRTSTINSLRDRGFIRLWTPAKKMPLTARQFRIRFEMADWAVTATGCRALEGI